VRGYFAYSSEVIALIRRLALPVAITSIVVNAVMLVASLIIWWMAAAKGWLDEVTFVSHVSMLALVFSAVSGVAAAVAGVLALVPTDDILSEDG
jgi:hypothetical protein